MPPGYCSLSKGGPAGREVFEKQSESFTRDVKLVEALVPCAELSQLSAGKVVFFSTWMQLQVLTPNGQDRVIDMPRAQVVRAVGKQAERRDMDSLFKIIDKRLKETDPDVVVSDREVQIVGADDNALYMTMQQSMSGADFGPQPVYGVIGMTLANRLLVNVASYQNLKLAGDRTLASRNMRRLLESVLKN